MKVKFKRLSEFAKIPAYSKPGDAGMDLTAVNYQTDIHGNIIYGTGLAVEIPEGYVGLVFPRSSNRKTKAYLTNHVGVIDSGYRGEIMVTYKNVDLSFDEPYNIGDRIAQLIIIPYPLIEPIEANELSETERGEGGHGSTGN